MKCQRRSPRYVSQIKTCFIISRLALTKRRQGCSIVIVIAIGTPSSLRSVVQIRLARILLPIYYAITIRGQYYMLYPSTSGQIVGRTIFTCIISNKIKIMNYILVSTSYSQYCQILLLLVVLHCTQCNDYIILHQGLLLPSISISID